MTTPVKCEDSTCKNEAVVGLLTKQTTRWPTTVTQQIWYEIDDAPKKASRLCQTHLLLIMPGLIRALAYEDTEMEKTS